MIEKELITKKLCIKIISENLKSLWLYFIFSAFIYSLSVFLISLFVKIDVLIVIPIYILLDLGWTIYFINAVRDIIIDIIKLYSGKCYVKEMHLSAKEHLKNGEDFFDRVIRHKYIYNFSKYGKYIRSVTKSYIAETYPWSKENKMDLETFYAITEAGDKFYILVRGGKKKKIFEIFHERLFELDKESFTHMFDKYYI